MDYTKLIIARLPHAGLGNKLFVWAQTIVAARTNQCNYLIFGWSALHFRTLIKIFIKGERRHEYYLSPFNTPNNYLFSLLTVIVANRKFYLQQEICDKVFEKKSIAYFKELPDPLDYFIKIREYRQLIKEDFFNNLKNKYKAGLEPYNYHFIGVHIRRGDMMQIKLTPVYYFINIIKLLRGFMNSDIPVIVFTDSDAEDRDFDLIKNLGKVTIKKNEHAIVDMAILSKAKIIVLSDKSTFGKWAGFLSESIIIEHPDYSGNPIRDNKTNEKKYEGVLPSDSNLWSPILKENLMEIALLE